MFRWDTKNSFESRHVMTFGDHSSFAFGPSVEWLAAVLTGKRYDIRIKLKGRAYNRFSNLL